MGAPFLNIACQSTSDRKLQRSAFAILEQREEIKNSAVLDRKYAIDFIGGYNQTQVARCNPPLWNGLFMAAKAGDKEAYRTLLSEFAVWLDHFIELELPSSARSDLICEVLQTLHSKRHSCDLCKPVLLWLLAITECRVRYPLR